MGQIVSIQSYRGGTGKSNLAANLSVALADRGRRVAVLDTDLASPGVHVLFNFDMSRLSHGLGDFLQGRCDLEDVAYDVSESAGLTSGTLFLIPSHLKTEAILRLVAEGYDIAALQRRLVGFMTELKLDHLVLDTHPGLNRETLLTTAISDALLILIRPDRQDFYGTAVIAELATRLKTREAWLVANKVLARTDKEELGRKLKALFEREVIETLPLSEDLLALGSAGLFLRTHPDHAYSQGIRRIASRLLNAAAASAKR